MRLPTLLSAIIDVILPKRERSVLVGTLSLENVSIVPEAHDFRGIRITSLLRYDDTATEALIRALKYDDSQRAANILALSLGEYLMDVLSEHSLFSARPVYIVPVPLHNARMRERGFNQISRVLDALPDHLRTRVRKDMLVRTRNTPPQTRLSRRARLTNVAGAFTVNMSHNPRGAIVFLIDDVTTTGATLAESAHILKEAGADVLAIAIARA